MSKLEKVNNALNDYVITTNTDCRHKYKYTLRNIHNNNIISCSFKNLDEIIKQYSLLI